MKIEFSKDQIFERMRFENPWWKQGNIESHYSEMKRREYYKMLFPLVVEKRIKRAVVLMGPRRVGKTVLIFHSIEGLIKEMKISPKNICYISVETPIYNGVGLEELLSHFLELNGNNKNDDLFLFFDEIQYLKDWEVHLKTLVDSYHNIKFVVSGSAAAALRLKSNESGAGRFTEFILPPLTFHEYLSLKNKNELVISEEYTVDVEGLSQIFTRYSCDEIETLNKHFVEYINFGGYPEVSLSEVIQSDPGRYIRNDIIDKVLLRDLPVLYGIEDIQELNSLFTYIAYNTGGEMSLEGISQKSGVSKNTIKKYLSYLEAAFLIRTIQRVDNNAKKFKRAHNFKIYLTNPSLRCALFSPLKEDDSFMGNMVETAIFSQWQHHETPLYYARWNTGEVDMVYLEGSEQKPHWAIEIKWSNKCVNDSKELKNIKAFCNTHNLKHAMVTTYNIRQMSTLEAIEYEFIPASLYCYMVGRNLVESKNSRRIAKPKIIQQELFDSIDS